MVNKKFKKILQIINKFRDDRDWLQFHNPKDMSAALAIEASELQELFLWKNIEEVKKFVRDKKNLENISDELADIFAFAIELADSLGIDIENAIQKKFIKNDKKYPVKKARGKHSKYDKL